MWKSGWPLFLGRLELNRASGLLFQGQHKRPRERNLFVGTALGHGQVGVRGWHLDSLLHYAPPHLLQGDKLILSTGTQGQFLFIPMGRGSIVLVKV